jgi:hypothetical protein
MEFSFHSSCEFDSITVRLGAGLFSSLFILAGTHSIFFIHTEGSFYMNSNYYTGIDTSKYTKKKTAGTAAVRSDDFECSELQAVL